MKAGARGHLVRETVKNPKNSQTWFFIFFYTHTHTHTFPFFFLVFLVFLMFLLSDVFWILLEMIFVSCLPNRK